MSFFDTIEKIIKTLLLAGEDDLSRLIKNARIKGGGSLGEVLSIVCSLLLVYEMKYPAVFKLIDDDANHLFDLARGSGMIIKANEQLLNELDWYD